jgi:hypothetical protein
MTTSEELLMAAMWMMIIGGVVGVIGLVSIFSSDGQSRGDLSKPLMLVGFGLFSLGAFVDYQWGSYW